MTKSRANGPRVVIGRVVVVVVEMTQNGHSATIWFLLRDVTNPAQWEDKYGRVVKKP